MIYDVDQITLQLHCRSNCAAVIMRDTIVVFGGESRSQKGQYAEVKTAEYLVLGESTWKKTSINAL